MTPDEAQAPLVSAKLTMVRYRNALQTIKALAADRPDITRLATKALRL